MGSFVERQSQGTDDETPAATPPKSCGCKGRCHSKPAEEAAEEVVEEVAEASAAVAVAEEEPHGHGCGCKHHGPSEASAERAEGQQSGKKCNCQGMLWIRKVHSAAGLVFGGFLVEHLAATSLGTQPGLFGRYMQFVHAMIAEAPWLHALIYTPLAVAAAFGGYLLAKAGVRYNVKKCNRGGKLRYWLQRATAVVLLAFLAFHLLTLRNYSAATAGIGATVPGEVLAASVLGFQADWAGSPLRMLAIAGVLLGTWAAVYHVSNGMWSASIAWGLSETPDSQRRWQWVCLGGGVVLAILGTMGWAAFCGA